MNHQLRSLANSARLAQISSTIASRPLSQMVHTNGLPHAPCTSFVYCQRTVSPTANLCPQRAHRNFSPGFPHPQRVSRSFCVAIHGLPSVKLMTSFLALSAYEPAFSILRRSPEQ